MAIDQIFSVAVLAYALVMFVWGKVRYDLVALSALCLCVILGIIPAQKAFAGFAHPAIVMTGSILILTKAIEASGCLDIFIQNLYRLSDNNTLQFFLLIVLVAIFSAFMNNIGALSLMLPVAFQYSKKAGVSPSLVLMPLSFSSLLGGLMTMIGTPPNIIIANYRLQTGKAAFGMFDFSYVGVGVALTGILFVSFLGRYFLPIRSEDEDDGDLFHIKNYITEIGFLPEASLIGKPLEDLITSIDHEIQILSIIRGKKQILSPTLHETMMSQDILVLEGEPDAIKKLLDSQPIRLVGRKELESIQLNVPGIQMLEVIVPPASYIEGKSTRNFFKRFDAILLAISRRGKRFVQRMGSIRFRSGDIILIQSTKEGLKSAIANTGCLPLAGRDLSPIKGNISYVPLIVFFTAITALIMEWLPASMAFLMAVVTLLLIEKISLKQAYDALDGSIIILIGCLLPLGEAVNNTGVISILAKGFISGTHFSDVFVITTLLVTTMLLSDLMNNTATAVIMAPIAVELAYGMGVSADPLLMTVALGSSCTFLTPIGHPSNTLVMNPGKYHFGDFSKLGFPLDILILIVGVPLILWMWPLV